MRSKSMVFSLLLLMPILTQAYIGYQNFTLDDDNDFRQLRQSVEIASQRLIYSQNELRDAQIQDRDLRNQDSQLREIVTKNPIEIHRLQSVAEKLIQEIPQLQNELSQIQTALGAAQGQLQEVHRQIESTQNQIVVANQDLTQTQASCAPVGSDACNALINDKKNVLDNLQGSLIGLQGQKGLLEKQSQELYGATQKIFPKIKSDQERLSHVQSKIPILQRQTEDSYNQLTQVDQKIQQADQRLAYAQGQLQLDENGYRSVTSEFERYKNDLLYNIDQFNNNGSVKGESDGRQDGSEQARLQGEDQGRQDGLQDGKNEGTQNGKSRDYANGERAGESEGTTQGQLNGTLDGKTQGIQNALQDVGTKEGIVYGIARAEKSDAKIVGVQQGVESGMARSLKDGQIQGRKLGQDEAIKQSEQGELQKINLEGPYAQMVIQGNFQGAFSRLIPMMPQGFHGRTFNSNIFYGKDIYRRAFADGYNYSYEQNIRIEFDRLIGSIYNSIYDNNYKTSYNSAFSQSYQESYNKGYQDGFNKVYQRVYTDAKKRQYQQSYNETVSHPDRQRTEYTLAFQKNESSAYNKKYEEIRLQAFIDADTETYNKNINLRIAEFKSQRFAEVKEVYANHAILAFDSSTILDAGVQKITPHDGFYQPGETILHSIVIKNFGAKSLVGGKIRALTGEEALLPDIPARSIVNITGAIISSIADSAVVKSTHQAIIQVLAPLTSQDLVQAVHYDLPAKALLRAREIKEVTVAYPIFVSGVKNDFQYSGLKFGQMQQLKLSLLNMADIIYNNLDVEVSSNSSNEIFISKFASLPEVNSGLELEDAKIMITDRNDIKRTIEIKAQLKYKGVVLGIINKPISFIVKP